MRKIFSSPRWPTDPSDPNWKPELLLRSREKTARMRIPATDPHSKYNTPHLRSFDLKPDVDTTRVTVYSMRFCPHSHRVILLLLAKGVPFDVVNIDLSDKPEWFYPKKTMYGKVPVIQYQNHLISESQVIVEYIEEKFSKSHRRLQPKTPEMRARDRVILEKFPVFTRALDTFLRNGDVHEVSVPIKDFLRIIHNELIFHRFDL